MYKLYIFVRSDLESLTPGKCAAQCAHAATAHATVYLHGSYDFNIDENYSGWTGDSLFGTTVVLDGGSFEEFSDIKPNNSCFIVYSCPDTDELIHAHMITDTSYPLRDGKVTHLLNIHTCYWMFVDPEEQSLEFQDWLKSFKLYNGNHD